MEIPLSSPTMSFASASDSFRDCVKAVFMKTPDSDQKYASMHFQGVFSGADMMKGILEAKNREREFLRNVFSGLVDRYCQIMDVQENMRLQLENENLKLQNKINDVELENGLFKDDRVYYARQFEFKNQEIQQKFMEINNYRRSYEALLHDNAKLESQCILLKCKSRENIKALMKEISDISNEIRLIYHVMDAHSFTDGFVAPSAIPVAASPDEKYIMLMKVPEQQESIDLMRFIQSQLLGFNDIVSDVSVELHKARNYEEDMLSLTDDREKLRKEADGYRLKMEKLEDEKLRVEYEKDNHFSKNIQLQSQINQLRLELADASRNIRVKEGEVNNLNEEKRDRLQAIKALEGKNKELREKLKNVSSELESYKISASTKLDDFARELRAQVKKEYEQLTSDFMAKCEDRASEICSDFEAYYQEFSEKGENICNNVDRCLSNVMNIRFGDESDTRVDLMDQQIKVLQNELSMLQQEYDKLSEWYNTSEDNNKKLARKVLEVEEQLKHCITQSAEYKEEVKAAREILSENTKLPVMVAKIEELEKALSAAKFKEKNLRDIINKLRATTQEKLAMTGIAKLVGGIQNLRGLEYSECCSGLCVDTSEAADSLFDELHRAATSKKQDKRGGRG